MSNGEDVLDSWEEIDEAGLTNTLQKIQAERQKSSTTAPTTINATAVEQSTTIETSTNSTNCFNNDTNHLQPMKLLQRNSSENANGATTTVVKSTTTNAGSDESANVKSPLDDMSATFQPVLMVLHKPTDEYQSANYTQPMQTVKILRRPTQSSDRRNNDLRPKQPIKTLQQREQEYAEARLRILGSAKNPEDDVEQNPPEANALPYELQKPPPTAIDTKAPANVASNTTPTISRTNSTPKMQQHHQQQQSPGISLGVIGGSSGGGGVGGVGGGGVVGVGNNMPPSPGNLKYHNHYYMQHQLLQQQANYYFQQQQQPPQQQHYQQQQQIGAAVAPVPSLPLPAPAYNNRSTMPGGAPLATAANNRNPHQTPAHLKYQQQQKLQQQQQLQQQYGQTWSSPTSTPTSNNAINASAPMTRTQQQESILRLPRGPDGSVGFQMRR